MRDVVVAGVGMCEFGLMPDRTLRQMAEVAVHAALVDAGMRPQRVDASYYGYCLGKLNGQECMPGQLVLHGVGIAGVPIVRIESACASSSAAFREAYRNVAAGLHDVVLAFGLEKMTGSPPDDARRAMAGGADTELEGNLGITFPGVFGLIANRHMHEFGTTRAQMAAVSVKNRANAARNPMAQFREPVTLEQVLASRMIARPLRLLECSALSDGCSAAVLTTPELARRFSQARPVFVRAAALGGGELRDDADSVSFPASARAARAAYEAAGIGPEDVDLAEVHDCFSVAEIVHTEDLGFCPKGEGGPLVESGATRIGGRIPVNASGGLIGKGHPLGATGIAQVVELVNQLRGRAGARQVEGARVGLAQTLGGFSHGDVLSVAVSILST